VIAGELVRFIESCGALLADNNMSTQVHLPFVSHHIAVGEVGIVLKKDYYEEIGDLYEILIGNSIFWDIPSEKIERLPTATA